MASQRLEAAYTAQVRAVRARVSAFAAARFGAGQYRDADLARFVAEVVPVVLAGRRQTAALTDSYLQQTLAAAGIKVPKAPPVDTVALRGVPAAEVYARPYTTVRASLADGKAFDAAVRAGGARLVDLIASDMQLARTHTARHVFSRTGGVRGYSRVVSGNKTCAMCYVASTQVYHKADLMPIHPGCSCGVDPITADNPWDQAAADERLSATHAAVEDRLGTFDPGARAPDYRKLVVVREHGELGPVLTVKGQHFDGPSVA